MAQLNVSKTRDFHSQLQKTPQVIHIEAFHNLLLVMQNNCAALWVTQLEITAGIFSFQTL